MVILLVDDEAQILQVLGEFLAECGYEICRAKDGKEALQVLEEEGEVGLVISDIRMPRLDGLRLLRAVRVRFPGIPVVLMTGHGDEEVAVSALQEGATNYLKKPIKLNDLLECVEQVEARGRLESELLGDYQNPFGAGVEGQPPREEKRGANGSERHDPEPDGEWQAAQVLIVDSQVEDRHALEEMLRAWGHIVQVVDSAEKGLAQVADHRFDVALVEMELPQLDGIEVIQQIRGADPTAVPILLTSRNDPEVVARALASGVRGLLIRPFAPEELKRRIASALQERKHFVDTRLLLGELLQTRGDLRQKVAERERFMSHLVDAAPFAVVSTDRQGRILTFNGRAEEIYGLRQEDAIGCALPQVFAQDPEEPAGNGQAVVKVHHRRRNGERFPALVRRREILDPKGRCLAHLHVVEDLTERERMEAQLFYAERLSMLGQLAPRIAHEFKTPLQVILGQVEIALMDLADGRGEELHQSISDIKPAVSQLLELVQQLANLGKPVESREQELDLGVELHKTLESLKGLGVVKYCELVQEIDDALPPVFGDPAQFQQVFRNLIVNAAQAMEKTRVRQLRLALRRAQDGKAVEVRVEDTGPGIPRENLERIFQPFFTTKPEGIGTGLGLSIVKSVLDRHGASLKVESEVGQGTRFLIAIPVVSR
jgi:PAS domain S-box-containing protein